MDTNTQTAPVDTAASEVPAAPPAPTINMPYRSGWIDMIETAHDYGWVEVNGLRTRYLRAGPEGAPAVIMMHGTSGTLDTFTPTFAGLAKEFRCYAFDMMGSGWSDKPEHDYEIHHYVEHTRAFMDVMGIAHASFIGLSLGGWIASRFALDFPERTDKLVLLSIPGLINNSATQARASASRSKAVETPTWDVVTGVLGKLVRNPLKITHDMATIRQINYSAPGAKETMARVLVLQQYEVRERNNLSREEWAAITAPTLIFAAVDDKNVWLDTAYELEKIMPHVRLYEMPGVNHWPQFEKPEEFNQVVGDFLSEA